ncbi:DinB family protein [Bacillus sp. FJAT-47783]|uniref:DinB family protein n=1 Tax=Bacillus sp. FJAT-47783 TaxID=2922712 RepID=UPI001FADE8AF|nr:DinB family protein [Bacillus sp. FJAT-47783]
MGETLLFEHVKTTREITENMLKKIPESDFMDIPAGFNNNLLWNFGHIAYVQDMLVYHLIGETMHVPDSYETYFARGTKPKDWALAPPTIDEVKMVLVEQKERIHENLRGKLDTPLPQPFTNGTGKEFYTVGETLLFSTYHEALHMNTILRIYRSLKQTQKV